MAQIHTTLSDENIAKLEQIAKKKELSRAAVMRMLLVEKIKEVAPSILDGQSDEAKEPATTPV